MQENGLDIIITVPEYYKNEDIVFYQLQFQDTKHQNLFTNQYRYSELKKFHQTLETLKITLPQFPGTHWWKSVNTNIILIQERREQLDQYFRNLLQLRQIRECLIFKNFLLSAKKDNEKRIEKEQKEKLKKLEGHSSKTKKKQSQPLYYATPAPNPVNLPPTPGEVKERSQSVEHKPVKQKTPSGSRKASKQSPILNFGGSKMFRGILSNAAKQ